MNVDRNMLARIAIFVSVLSILYMLGSWYVVGVFEIAQQIALGVAIIGGALAVYFEPKNAVQILTGRQARFGSNAFLMIIAFLGILVMLNLLVYNNAQELGLRWDLTEDQERTLTRETISTLSSLQSPVVVQAFYTVSNPGQGNAKELLDDYQFYAKGNLVYEIINPEDDPFAAQEAGISQDGSLVFSLDDYSEIITRISEQEFTNAILKLLNPGNRTVYFLTGHGEYTVDQGGDDSLSQLRAALLRKNYEVESLNLLTTPEIPGDASVIVIAGPIRPVKQAEMDLIREFVGRGGSLIVAQDPVPLTEFGDSEDPVSNYLSEEWGIAYGDDLIVDLQAVQIFNSPYIAISGLYEPHPISEDLLQRQLATIFPLARSVTVAPVEDPDVSSRILVSTSEQSWAETNFESINDGSLDLDELDLAGPVGVVAVAERFSTGARVVVFGDSDFFANANYQEFGNADLILNSTDWVTNQEDLIRLSPKPQTQRFIAPPQGNFVNLIALLVVIVLPGIVMIAGIVVWVRRRQRG